ncbi:hypothetical protein GS455_22060 [Rhodococcus hoagii]|nr:hypothetical protein [Prescottella equi]
MLPYLVATGTIADQTPGWSTALLVLAGYCLVMVAPALVLTADGSWPLRRRGTLKRLDTWLTRNARTTTLWIIGIAGFFLAATRASRPRLVGTALTHNGRSDNHVDETAGYSLCRGHTSICSRVGL